MDPHSLNVNRLRYSKHIMHRDIPGDTQEVERLIDLYIRHKRNRDIAKRRLLDGIRYCEIAEDFKLTEKQIKNIVYNVEEELFRHLH